MDANENQNQLMDPPNGDDSPRALGATTPTEFSLHCGNCGRVMLAHGEPPTVSYRCYPCKRAVVRQDVPSASSGAEAESPVGRPQGERGALDAAGAERTLLGRADGPALETVA